MAFAEKHSLSELRKFIRTGIFVLLFTSDYELKAWSTQKIQEKFLVHIFFTESSLCCRSNKTSPALVMHTHWSSWTAFGNPDPEFIHSEKALITTAHVRCTRLKYEANVGHASAWNASQIPALDLFRD